jgi:hypothetical protein
MLSFLFKKFALKLENKLAILTHKTAILLKKITANINSQMHSDHYIDHSSSSWPARSSTKWPCCTSTITASCPSTSGSASGFYALHSFRRYYGNYVVCRSRQTPQRPVLQRDFSPEIWLFWPIGVYNHRRPREHYSSKKGGRQTDGLDPWSVLPLGVGYSNGSHPHPWGCVRTEQPTALWFFSTRKMFISFLNTLRLLYVPPVVTINAVILCRIRPTSPSR